MKKLLLLPALLLFCSLGFSQLTVTSGLSAPDFINWAQGPGLTISNVTFSGAPEQFGSFTNGSNPMAFVNGVLLSTGDVNMAAGPNDQMSSSMPMGGGNDPDMDLAVGFNTNDVAIIEFDFVPNFQYMVYDYIFGSEEYPEFVGSNFNDGFVVLVSGPGINGPYSNGAENFCMVPGTSETVAINTVNNGVDETGPCTNCAHYISNPQNSDANGIQADGLTNVLVGSVAVTPGQTYHVKIAVADAADQIFDSYLFIGEEAFKSVTALSIAQEEFNPPMSFVQNPVDEEFFFDFNDYLIERLEIIDINGRLVRSASVNVSRLTLSAQGLDQGTYIIRYVDSSGAISEQKVVKR